MTVRKYGQLSRILELDPVSDHSEIYRLSFGYEFPWEYRIAGRVALLNTFCAPSISELLIASQGFVEDNQRRYDNTAILITELAHNGYDSARGRQVISMMNRVHSHYAISNEDMLYVLAGLIFDPIAWIDRFGWRPLSRHEKHATFHFYREVGRRMAIRDIPECYDELLQFKLDYERTRFRYAASSRELGERSLRLMCSWYPRPVRGVIRRGVLALLDPLLLTAFGYAPPSPVTRFLAVKALRLRARAVRLLPARKAVAPVVRDRDNHSYPGYPEAYDLPDLARSGPPTGIDPRWLRPSRHEPHRSSS
ncbi:oxygenase MpaB family protein [Allokutzneria oryzae]|uniref:Oxygenase MpaB family protein n=1 Tax=Allokutzneria oryzae TaxID=1378989 RepID=A0ABV6A776_9PSEU